MLVRKEHANEMAVADMGKAPTAVRKPKNQKSRDITTFEEGPNTSERNRHVAAQPTAASAAGIQATFICGGLLLWSLVSVSRMQQKREIEPTFYFACGAKLPERKIRRGGGAILYHVWRVLT